MGFLEAISAASAILLLLGGQVATAQPETKTYTLEDALQVCARVPKPADRLACFEGLARSAAPEAGKQTTDAAKTASGAPVVAPTSQVTSETERSRYVVLRADDYKAERRKAEKSSKPDRQAYDGVVLRAWGYGNGEYFIALTNGEIWKSDAREKPRPVKDHEEVQLNPGAVGGWFMQFKTLKRPDIKVIRVE